MGRGRFGATCSSDWCALQEALYKCIYTIHEFVITVFGFCVSRMQSYGTTPGPGEEHSSIPSAPPSSEGLGFPGGAHGNQYPPPGSGYAPAGQGYPPAEKGYPPAGPGYPPAGPGYPPAGQGYPPAGAGYPPAGQVYPPAGAGYPPAGQGYQQGGQSGCAGIHLDSLPLLIRNSGLYCFAFIHIHGVSEKTMQNCFCQNFVKFSSIVTICG